VFDLRGLTIGLVLLAACRPTRAQEQAEHQRQVAWCKGEIYARSQLQAIRAGMRYSIADSFAKRLVASWERGVLEDSSFVPVPCRRMIL
jgi:hypothetical protein